MATVTPSPELKCVCGQRAEWEIRNARATLHGFFCSRCRDVELEWLQLEQTLLKRFHEIVTSPLPQLPPGERLSLGEMLRNGTIESR